MKIENKFCGVGMETMKTGTTTVGIKFKDGVVLATESKSSMGTLVSSKEARKIYQVDDRIALTVAGAVGDIQQLVRIIKAEINLYKFGRDSEVTVGAVSTLLANILQSSRMFPRIAMFIIGGVDRNGPQLRSLDPLGGESEEEEYMATGSGSAIAYGVLENGFKKNMDRDEALKLAIQAIKSAKERDVFSGGRKIQAVVIDENGLEEVDEKTIQEISK